MKPKLLPLVHVAIFASAISAQAAEFKFATQTLTVPDGFTIELIAGPPLVNRPISIAFDEQGHLYATDSAGMSDKAEKQLETKPHRIVRLEDSNDDGRFDKSVVYAEHMMFPEGAMFYEGSLYVSAPPQIWKLTDTDGDGVADKREVWFDGETLTGCANDLHGPYLGPDGWFYWCKGAFAEQRHTLPNGKPFVTRASHIFRARPDGTSMEPVLTGGMDNPVGVAFTSTGERFLSCTFFQNPAGGKRDGLIHAIYGGVYGKDHDVLTGHARTGDLMPVMTHMSAAAPCGLTTYRSRIFGSGFYDNLFACYFNLHKVVRHELLPNGATFKTKDTDFVTSDSHDFHPTDVLEDADGSLIIADTGGWYKVCCPTSQLAKPDVLGGIYRIRKNSTPKREDPRGLKLAWPKMKPVELAKLLGDERLYVRQRAIHELGKQGDAAVPALREIIASAPKPAPWKSKKDWAENYSRVVAARTNDWLNGASKRINAVWALTRIESPHAREAARLAFRDPDTNVRQVALQSASLHRDQKAAELGEPESDIFMILPEDRHYFELLGRTGQFDKHGPRHARSMLYEGFLRPSEDRVLNHSFTFAMIESKALKAARSFFWEQNDYVPAKLIALDQMENGDLKPEEAIRFLRSDWPDSKKAALWVVSHRPEWGPQLTTFFRERLAARLSDAERDELLGLLTQLAKSPEIQTLLADTARADTAPATVRLLVLRAMASAGLKETPARWFAELVALLSGNDASLLRQAVTTARALPLPKQGHTELSAALFSVGHNNNVFADVRLDALAATANPAAIEPALFDFLTAHLAGTQPMLMRSAAANVLAKAHLTPEQQLALADAMQRLGPLETPKLLPVFEKSPTETLGLKLVASLKQSTGLAGLRVDLLKPLFAKYPPSVQQQGEALLTLLNADAAKQTAHLEELLATCKNGDIRRGEAIFNSAKAACATCHAMGYLGGRLGPDLTRIGQARNERDLLEAIIYPSASFVRSYEPFTVTTKGGEDYSGIIRKDAPDEVVLATGPETEQRVPRADIVAMRPGAVSLMPAGLDTVLTKQELADLLAFLKATQ